MQRVANVHHKSQVAREALCSDLLMIPQAACAGETLSRKGLSWPSLCDGQVLDKGTKELTDGNAQDNQSLPFFC